LRIDRLCRNNLARKFKTATTAKVVTTPLTAPLEVNDREEERSSMVSESRDEFEISGKKGKYVL